MDFDAFSDTLSRQRAIRNFDTSRDVDDATIEKLIKAATFAPSGGNRQPWRFVVIRDAGQKQKLREIYDGEVAKYMGGRAPSGPGQTPWTDVPVLIAVCTEGEGAGPMPASIFPAVQNLLLSANTLGLGSVLTTLWKAQEPAVKKVLDLPDNLEIHAILPVGYPDRKYGRGKRRPISEVTYRDRYGQGW